MDWDRGEKGTVWFVLITDYWWVVNCKTLGQIGQEELYGFY
jgi:hypothetical protein